MEKILFELSNEQRKHLGLVPVERQWELVKLNDSFLYFDGDIIRKKITVNHDGYFEQELCERTAENRTILLPKTEKGKPKKLNFTATQSFSSFGVYFSFSKNSILLANYTTQTTFFSGLFDNVENIEGLKRWVEQWVADSTEGDLREIEAFRTAQRQHCKFEEGDFFAFKIGRRQWGFGQILLDVSKRRKTEEFKKQKNLGLAYLMGKPLIVKVYHKISDTLNINLDELTNAMALPSQAVMDNHFFYGENKIIGHKDFVTGGYDMFISYGRCRDNNDRVYLQYGLIYKELDIRKFGKYLQQEGNMVNSPYSNIGICFGLDIDNLQQCIESQSNKPYWESKYYYQRKWDLRNPENREIKREIFRAFGLDTDKSYEDNLKKEDRKAGFGIMDKIKKFSSILPKSE
jgi:hypothetical protein